MGLGHESGAGAAGVAPTATEDARRARPRPSLTSVFNVEVGEFVALATPPAEKAAVSIGLVLAKKGSDEEGRELELRWYRPARVDPNSSRDTYGRGRWTGEFLRQDEGKLVPSLGTKAMAAVSATSSQHRASSGTTYGRL